MSFEVRVPASSANLGPGFDSLAVALTIYLRVTVDLNRQSLNPPAALDLLGGEDMVALGMRRMAEELGRELPPCDVRAESDIPVARGLGSSAAAIVAGLQIGAILAGENEIMPEELVAIGGAIEGHADNISAAVMGGVTVAISTGAGHKAACISTSLPWQPLLFVPDAAAFTNDARGILPARVPLADASANIGRSALLVQALHTADSELLGWAMDDRLHQPYRAKLFPHLEPMIACARSAGAAGACLSGAGPTVLVLSPVDHVERVTDAIDCAAAKLSVPGTLHAPSVDQAGVTVRTAG